MTVHVLAYLPRLPRVLAAEFAGSAASEHSTAPGRPADRAAAVLGGRGVRLSLLVASLLAGLLIAVLTVHLAAPWHFASFH